MRTKAGAWTVALLAAALLVAVGFGLASDYYQGELQRCREKALLAQARAERLRAEIDGAGRLAAGGSDPLAALAEPEAAGLAEGKLLLRPQRAVAALNGRVVFTLEELDAAGGRARVRVKVLGGKEGLVIMRPGQSVSFRLDGSLYRLVLEKTEGSAAAFALVSR
ncbi:hypothetical protein AAU61_04520 [Desulfocarbo indianensis]|nr:hypothetical protein AAU61_04520 [Desulfocarbo indianensis]